MTGSLPFQLTPPTSNSGGAFSFTSSNTAVATINGTTVTVVGAGVSTITATQAAFGTFASGTATATFTVTANIPTANIASDNFKNSNVALTTLSNYSHLLEQAMDSKYITEKELETLSEWRKDPGNWKS